MLGGRFVQAPPARDRAKRMRRFIAEVRGSMSAMGCSLCAFGRRIPSSEQSAALGRPCARISEGARSCSRPSERDVRPVGRTQRGRGGAHREHDEGIGRQGGAPSSSPRSNAEALVRVPVWASGGVDRGRPGPPRSNAEVFGALTRSGVGRGRRGGAELGAEPRSSVPRGRTQRSSARSRARTAAVPTSWAKGVSRAPRRRCVLARCPTRWARARSDCALELGTPRSNVVFSPQIFARPHEARVRIW